MKKLAEKLLTERRQKAVEMVGKKVEIQISHKAISIDLEKHTATFVMSTTAIDRHGDVVDQDSWIMDYFNTNPAFYFQHRTSDSFPLGRWLKVWFEADPANIEKKRMIGEAYFATEIDEDAKRAWDHVVDGNLSMVSVGFIPHRVEYDEERDAFILFDCELLECSLVGIGSNRQALIKDKEVEEVRTNLIDNKNILDELIKADNNVIVSAHLKARSQLHKAIRSLAK